MLKDAVGMGQVLDKLVETWISLANELIERGDQVSLVTALDDGDGNIVIEHISCTTGNRRRWQDMGARARWQGSFDLPGVLASLGDDLHAIAVSSRFFSPPPESLGGESFTWVYRPPIDALGMSDPPFWRVIAGPGNGSLFHLFALLARLPAPAGSDENGTVRQVKDILWRYRVYQARRRLRRVAFYQGQRTQDALVSRNETVYRLEPGVRGHRLVGLVGGDA